MITREHRRRNRYTAHRMRQRGRSLDDIAGHLRVTKRSVMRYLAEPDPGEPAAPKPAAQLADSFDGDQRGHHHRRAKEIAMTLTRLGIGAPDQDWVRDAVCVQTDPEAFFPEPGGSTRGAKKICMGCERFGIWGGLSELERRRLKRGIA